MKFNLTPILYYTILYYNYIFCSSYFIKLQNIMFALKTYKFSKNILLSENKSEINIQNKFLRILLWH